MSALKKILEDIKHADMTLETYGRQGNCTRCLSGGDFVEAVCRYRQGFSGWETRSYENHKVIGLLFKPEETIEFLIAAFAAIAEGFTVVPFYPNWSPEVQLLHLQQYGIRALAVGDGFSQRREEWRGELDHVVKVSASLDDYAEIGEGTAFPDNLPADHPCAWIFTSGTSGEVPKCTVISLRNVHAAIENIAHIDFINEGMTLHSPLSTSHIFAFAVVLGILAVKPRRVLFSDVQYLPRLDQEVIGKIDGVILVPLVLNRMRSAFYEKLVEDKPALESLAKIPRVFRRFLKHCIQHAEKTVIDMESGRPSGFVRWPAVALSRLLFGKVMSRRLGSPEFVVIGGAKPNVQTMAFFDVMGVRCLQGWGMTETTGALAVCNLKDRFKGAYGTCGEVFENTRAYIDSGELIVEGPQIAEGYMQPNGVFVPFNGVKRTGDFAEFDSKGRLKVLGKTSDRITLANGLNYNPIQIEERLLAADLTRRHLLEEIVIIGDGQARLGAVFFIRQQADAANDADMSTPPTGEAVDEYLQDLLRCFNTGSAADEQIGPWAVCSTPIRDTKFIGPSGKLKRRLIEEQYRHVYLDTIRLEKPPR